MITGRQCPSCGAVLPSDAPGGDCPRCLLKLGLRAALFGEVKETLLTAAETSEKVAPEIELEGYRIVGKLGEGGCGVVYKALQLEPLRREVAIKVIKLGMDTRSVIARFEAERQALAMMEHPGIAKVFDAGSTSKGRPFFVMELVAGETVTTFCAQQRLAIAERLQLFVEVCHAVQHAHQKGIIHRDIKPSNVLVATVDGRPQPKIIDFGVAKATAGQRLADQTVYTAFDQFVGTPAYMSPEQAGLTGEDVETRSDIYSLGVLLYELLTGAPPFDPQRLRSAALDEVCRIIREEDPIKPSTRLARELGTGRVTQCAAPSVEQTLPGGAHGVTRPTGSAFRSPVSAIPSDLDWIVMKALEKRPSGRYGTANDFAQDIEHHLKGEPVTARPPSTLYRLQKTVRRNKILFGAGTAVLMAFLVGFSLSTKRFFKKEPAHPASASAEKPIQMPEAATRSERVSRLLKEMLPQSEKDATSPEALGHLTEALLAQKRFSEAEDAAREAVTILTNPAELGDSRALGFITFGLVEALHGQKKWAEGEAIARDNVTLWRKQPNARRHLMDAVHWHSIVCYNQRKWAEAEPLLREAVQLCDEVQASGEALYQYSSAFCSQFRCELGSVLARQRKFAEAEAMLLAGYEGVRGQTGKWDVYYEQESMRLLAEMCDATERTEEAVQWKAKLADFKKAHPGN